MWFEMIDNEHNLHEMTSRNVRLPPPHLYPCVKSFKTQINDNKRFKIVTYLAKTFMSVHKFSLDSLYINLEKFLCD